MYQCFHQANGEEPDKTACSVQFSLFVYHYRVNRCAACSVEFLLDGIDVSKKCLE